MFSVNRRILYYERCSETAQSAASVDRLLASSIHKRLVSGLPALGFGRGVPDQ